MFGMTFSPEFELWLATVAVGLIGTSLLLGCAASHYLAKKESALWWLAMPVFAIIAFGFCLFAWIVWLEFFG